MVGVLLFSNGRVERLQEGSELIVGRKDCIDLVSTPLQVSRVQLVVRALSSRAAEVIAKGENPTLVKRTRGGQAERYLLLRGQKVEVHSGDKVRHGQV